MKNNSIPIEDILKKTTSFTESLEGLTSLYNKIKEEKNSSIKKEDQFEKDLLSLAQTILQLQKDTLSVLKELQQKAQAAPEVKQERPPVKEKPKEAFLAAETVFEVKVPAESKKEDVKPKTEEKILPDNKKEIVFEVKLQTEKKEEAKPKTEEKTQKTAKQKEEPVFEVKLRAK